MSFTFNSPRKLDVEESNPYAGLISRAMDTYMKGQKAKNMPRQIEADIFSKEIGPLAALASNPNFTGFNPEIQKMIAQRIGQHLQGRQGGSMGENQHGMSESTPGYANDEDIYNRLEKGAHATMSPGAMGNLGKSNIAGSIEKYIGQNPLSEFLGGNKTAGENAAFEQATEEAVQRLKMKGYSEITARKALERKPGENDKSWVKRIKPLFKRDINENAQITDIDQKIMRDEQERNEMQEPVGAEVRVEAPDGTIGWVPAKEAARLVKEHQLKYAKD